MILRVPPENLWPTGKTPQELADVFHSNGAMTPEESNALRAQQERGIENYRPPPRQFNAAEIEAEKQSLRLVETVSPEIVVPRGSVQQINAQRYLVPLSSTVNAEIIIHGQATSKDFKLLQKYVKLMSSVEIDLKVNSLPEETVTIKKPRKSYAASA